MQKQPVNIRCLKIAGAGELPIWPPEPEEHQSLDLQNLQHQSWIEPSCQRSHTWPYLLDSDPCFQNNDYNQWQATHMPQSDLNKYTTQRIEKAFGHARRASCYQLPMYGGSFITPSSRGYLIIKTCHIINIEFIHSTNLNAKYIQLQDGYLLQYV